MAQKESGFEKWKASTGNHNATLADYLKAITLHNEELKAKGRSVLPPNLRSLPGGVMVSLEGVSATELGTMAREHVQSSRTNQ